MIPRDLCCVGNTSQGVDVVGDADVLYSGPEQGDLDDRVYIRSAFLATWEIRPEQTSASGDLSIEYDMEEETASSYHRYKGNVSVCVMGYIYDALGFLGYNRGL